MTARVWLIGGTQESRHVVEHLQSHHAPPDNFVISATTDAARTLYPAAWQPQIWIGQLQEHQAEAFVSDHDITAILDLSHPFAVQISRLAIALAEQHAFPYLRYERAVIEAPTRTWRDCRDRPGYLAIPNLQWVFDQALLLAERTLLILGYRWLHQFAPYQPQSTLFARILPSPTALTTALAAGFTPDRLIALRPPVSPELERALWQHWHISQVVIKASGRPGGETAKQALAAELGVRLVCITRPTLTYPRQTDHLDTAIAFALRYGA